MKCHRLYIPLEYYFCSVIFRTTFSLTLVVLISQRAPFCFKPKLSQKWPPAPGCAVGSAGRTPSRANPPGWAYGSAVIRHCSVIFMHILLYNVIYEREKPFLRHSNKCLRNFFCFYLWPLSKVKRTINVLQRWVSLLLHQSRFTW